MAGKLLEARVTLNRVTRTLRQLREQLPSRPLSSVRLVVTGDRVIVRDRMASWALDSKQGVFGFDMEAEPAEIAPTVRFADKPLPVLDPSDTADDLYQSALDFELAGRGDDAREAYTAVLDKDPGNVEAKINLGRLLHGANRLAEAEALYRAALEQEPSNALASFNLGVVLEDQGLTEGAIAAYRRAIAIDDHYADAHFNLSRLLEAKGDKQAALRHLARFRRLTRS